MRTAEERLALLHRRAAALRRKRDRRALRSWGAATAGLLAALIGLTVLLDPVAHGLGQSGSTGATLLSEGAGGYVLVGVIAFMAGVALTAALIRRGKKTRFRQENRDGEEDRTAQ